jgi:Na+-translocating ferredoxin:NAD+ oxidoreductase RnfC subunit
MGQNMGEEMIRRIKEAGIVGAGGAGFPTHVKVSSTAKAVIVNGAECEPLLRVDQQLMSRKTKQMVEGLSVVMEITGAGEGVIALKAKYKEAIEQLKKEITGKPIRLKILDDFYPAGDEHVTVYETTGDLVPQGAIPLKVDCVVINVETLINIAEALEGKPVIHTYLTITGEIAKPTTMKIPVGTTIKEVLAIAGVKSLEGMKVIDGGPMMGKVVEDLSEPITKTTKGLIILPQDHPLIRKRQKAIDRIIKESNAACIQCRFCTDLCPRYLLGHKLEPHKIMRALGHIHGQEEALKMALVCSECGICEQYACIVDLSPRKINAMLKQELSKKGIKPDLPEEQTVSHMQQHRKIPVKRLISRLGLTQYDEKAPLEETQYQVNKVHIKLHQHLGVPSIPVVEVGQKVQRGSLIAKIPDNALGANIHASINGTIMEISDSIVITSGEGSDD